MRNLLNLKDIAELSGINHATVRVMRHRGQLPKPDDKMATIPLWRRSTISKWLKKTGRG